MRGGRQESESEEGEERGGQRKEGRGYMEGKQVKKERDDAHLLAALNVTA